VKLTKVPKNAGRRKKKEKKKQVAKNGAPTEEKATTSGRRPRSSCDQQMGTSQGWSPPLPPPEQPVPCHDLIGRCQPFIYLFFCLFFINFF
jgi:hypothetical protein